MMRSQNVVEEAVDSVRDGCSCSQAIASVFGRYYGLDEKLFFQISSGLAGGMAGAGETCGVLSAGIVIIGAIVGPRSVADVDRRKHAVMMSVDYMERFSSMTGSTLCAELSAGTDLRSDDSVKALRKSGKPEEMVRSGAQLLFELLPKEGRGLKKGLREP